MLKDVEVLVFLYWKCKEDITLSLSSQQICICLLLTVHFHLHLPMTAFYRKGDQKRTTKYISPPLSVVFLLHPKRGMSAYVRFDQKWGTKKPDLLWQIRKKVVEVTGFEPATFWSRTTISLSDTAMIYPTTPAFKRISSDRKLSYA